MTIKRWSEVSNARFIAADEFEGRDVTLTIKDIFVEDMTDFDGEPGKAGIVAFQETERQWRLNSTNRARMATIWPHPSDAIGRKVTLYAAPEPKSPTGLAVRVKGSPDLAGDTTTLDPIGLGKSRKFTLIRTADRVTPAPVPKNPPVEGEVKAARCLECGVVVDLTPDVTEADIADMTCGTCGAGVEVVRP